MRYMIVLLFALALPVSAQTAKIDGLRLELKAARRALNIELSKQSVVDATLDSVLIDSGFVALADTLYPDTEDSYIQIRLPAGSAREIKLDLREAEVRFLKTGSPRLIRIHKNFVGRFNAALTKGD